MNTMQGHFKYALVIKDRVLIISLENLFYLVTLRYSEPETVSQVNYFKP